MEWFRPWGTTLSSNTTATKETFIVLKISILQNSALYHLKANNLWFFHVKLQSTGSSSLVSTWFPNLTRFSLKTSFFSNFLCKNCFDFIKIEWKWLDLSRIHMNILIFCIFQIVLIIKEILAYIEIFFFSKHAKTCLATFSLKKVLWPNHLSQSFEILHEKT